MNMPDAVELEARLSALELVVLTHVLQSGLPSPLYDPRAFAAARRDAWAGVATAMCEGCTSQDEDRRFTHAYAASLERLGHLLVSLADPVQEAMDEVNAAGADSPGAEPT
jgi:glycine/D-amino acid oxidase-like deaminating enzyme